MKKIHIHLFLLCWTLVGTVNAQDCLSILHQAKTAYSSNNLKQALKKLQDTETCDYKNALLQERQALQSNIFKAIDDQRIEAENYAKRLEESAQKVRESQNETQIALRKAEVYVDSLNVVLENLGKANAACEVRLLLAEVERNQQELNFDVAVDKAKAAKTLGALPDAVDLAYLNLSRSLLSHAKEDLLQKAYQMASIKIKSAGELNVQPDSVAAANRALQRILIENARLDIMNSNFEAALEKINAMENLSVSQDTVAGIRFEIAFCYTETGQLNRAAALLDSVARLRNNDSARAFLLKLAGRVPAEQAQVLRQARRQIDPHRDSILTARYISPDFRQIPSGSIRAGDAHGGCEVTVKSFRLATKELTFFEYDLFCVATNRPMPPDNDWGRGRRPVINIDWYDAVEYCNWCSKRDGLQEVYSIDKGANAASLSPGARNEAVTCNWSANGYRLPTETEWEFAAGNGGKHTRYSWGNDLPKAQNGGNVADEATKTKIPNLDIFTGYSDGFLYTAPTGSYLPNDFGLYDMTGNVWEWCWDWYDKDYCTSNKERTAPQGPATGTDRVLRGGYWLSSPKDCLVGNRFFGNPNSRKVSIGFRLARNYP